MRATYEVGEREELLREEVDRRTPLVMFVGALCRLEFCEEVEEPVAFDRVRRVCPG